MDAGTMKALSQAGAVAALSLSGLGSALGTGAACASAIGAWKKCYAQNKPAPFQLAIFGGAPLTQTIYGMILMYFINQKAMEPAVVQSWPFFLAVGLIGGLAIGASAWMQGIAAAGACDSFTETGKGFANNLLALGIIETVAIFVMAFSLYVIMTSIG